MTALSVLIICASVAAISLRQEAGVPATKLRMRGGEQVPAGSVVAVSIEGVSLSGGGTPAAGTGRGAPGDVVIGWDRVAAVEGALAGESVALMPVADRVWRARTRLERGDMVGAEPLFEELFTLYAGRKGPTAGVVNAGLLRCRLARGAQTAAVVPWLAYLNAVGTEQQSLSPLLTTGSGPAAAPIIDTATGLAPALPPIWLNMPALQSLARGKWLAGGPGEDTGAAGRAATIALLYEQAAKFEAGLPVVLPATSGQDAGVALVRDIVVARVGDEAQRQEARRGLLTRLGKTPSTEWVEAWCRAGLGRSLIREESREDQLLGIAQLLQLPAQIDTVNPYLTGLALAEASVALVRLGDVDGALRLRDELAQNYPGHPALEWERIRGWTAQEDDATETDDAIKPATGSSSERATPGEPSPDLTLPLTPPGGPPG